MYMYVYVYVYICIAGKRKRHYTPIIYREKGFARVFDLVAFDMQDLQDDKVYRRATIIHVVTIRTNRRVILQDITRDICKLILSIILIKF